MTLIETTSTDPGTLVEALFARSADAVFILDDRTGQAARRWYDRRSSKLDLPEESGGQVLATSIHPDDLPEVLDGYARVVNGAEAASAFARVDASMGVAEDATLLVSFRRIDDLWEHGVLVQVWVIDGESVVSPNHDDLTSLSSLAAAAPVGLRVTAASGRVSFENDRFTVLADGRTERIASVVRLGLQTGTTMAEDLRTHDGRSLRLRVVPRLDATGRSVMAVASLEDVSRERAAEFGRVLAEQQFEAMFQSSPIATALVDTDGSFVRVNEAFGIVTGYDVDRLEQMRFQAIADPDDVDAGVELLAEVLRGERSSYQMEIRCHHASGHPLWVELNVAPVRDADGVVQHLVVHVEDITSRRALFAADGPAETLEYWATHDHLTALPNRRYLEQQLTQALASTRRLDHPLVMFMDLDDFKPVNDLLGHNVGDEVLRRTARRLRSAARERDIIARYGGDEFVVIAFGVRNPAELASVVDRIHTAVQAPMTIDGSTVRVGASVGIAVARPDDTATDLLGRADAAAYRAKAQGKNAVEVDG